MSGSRERLEVDATVEIRYRDEVTAQACWRAVSPDNYQAPKDIKIESETNRDELRITIASTKGLGSLLATVDDLLSCLQAAENVLNGLQIEEHR